MTKYQDYSFGDEFVMMTYIWVTTLVFLQAITDFGCAVKEERKQREEAIERKKGAVAVATLLEAELRTRHRAELQRRSRELAGRLRAAQDARTRDKKALLRRSLELAGDTNLATEAAFGDTEADRNRGEKELVAVGLTCGGGIERKSQIDQKTHHHRRNSSKLFETRRSRRTRRTSIETPAEFDRIRRKSPIVA